MSKKKFEKTHFKKNIFVERFAEININERDLFFFSSYFSGTVEEFNLKQTKLRKKTYVFLDWMGSELLGEHVEDLLPDPPTLREGGEGEVVRVHLPQPCTQRCSSRGIHLPPPCTQR